MPDVWAESMDPERFGKAVVLAAQLHSGQLRKGTKVAYLSHVIAVASLVAEDEGSEEAVLAAVLHDAAEDQGGEATLRLIESRLGVGVAEIVRECSDSLVEDKGPKEPWRDRKEAALRLLPTRSRDALLVIAADKLHNARSTAADLTLHGPGVWTRFKTGREGFVWYHQRMVAELQQLVPGSRSVALLEGEMAALVVDG